MTRESKFNIIVLAWRE